MKPSEVLSKRSRAYRDLELANKDLSEEELLELMVANPTLLRRPLVIGSGGATVGFNQKQLQEITSDEGSRR